MTTGGPGCRPDTAAIARDQAAVAAHYRNATGNRLIVRVLVLFLGIAAIAVVRHR